MFMVSFPDGYDCCSGSEANRHSWLKAFVYPVFCSCTYFCIDEKMKGFLKLSSAVALSCLAIEAAARVVAYSPLEWIIPYKREALQDIASVMDNRQE
jgi:hypothetical protein